MKRRTFLTMGAGVMAIVGAPACMTLGKRSHTHALSATAITQVLGNGMNLMAVVIEYSQPMMTKDLNQSAFSVTDYTVKKVYVSDRMTGNSLKMGRFVIVEIEPKSLVIKNKPSTQQKEAMAKIGGPGSAGDVKESAPLLASREVSINANGEHIKASRSLNLVFDDFKQFEFFDSKTGKTIRYNLFTPKNQRADKLYPLVLFMHDAGVTGKNTLATLYQGNGAIAWASEQAQQKNPCFVLAPQFDEVIADDQSHTSHYLEATINLITALEKQYAIDAKRRYTTGQSGGGMLSIAMNVNYPDFFAASYLVACQWDTNVVSPLSKNKIWITVSKDDNKAFPGQTAIVDTLEKQGAKVARAQWDAQWSEEEFQTAFNKMDAQHANINFVAFSEGSVFSKNESAAGASGHTNTWKYAYNIDPIREWIFRWQK